MIRFNHLHNTWEYCDSHNTHGEWKPVGAGWARWLVDQGYQVMETETVA